MNQIRNWLRRIKNNMGRRILPAAVILLCGLCVAALLCVYFRSWTRPHMMETAIALSEGWEYQTNSIKRTPIDNLSSGPYLQGGVTMSMYRVLDTQIKDAAIMIRANHQTAAVYLDNQPLYTDMVLRSDENPGMALHFILLPDDYVNKTLKVELTSPYTAYSGRTSPIMMGTIPSLEAWAMSRSMRSIVLMSMCLLLGLCVIALTCVQTFGGDTNTQWQNLALGVFAVIWALYYVCTEYIMFQFLTPELMSVTSLGLYYTFQAPLVLYFYFSFRRYKKIILPAVILHCGFPLTALALQFSGVVDLPRLLHINNILLAGLVFTVALTVMEAVKGNRMMALSTPFLAVAYCSMLYNFGVFYSRHGVVPYSYRDTYFLLILAVLVCNIWQFFSLYYKGRRENEALTLENRLARESCERIESHLREVGSLKHEMRKHFAALTAYLDAGRYGEAKSYLAKYYKQSAAVTEAVYHESFVINAVVGKLLRDAEENGVDVGLDLKATAIKIAEPDLYSLLSNMLENALEACMAAPEGQRRFITLSFIRREPYLAIICQNSRFGKALSEGGNPRTTKQEDGHGHGLLIIRQIAEAYRGLVDIEYDDTAFTLTVALKDCPA